MGSCDKGDEAAQRMTVVVTGFGPFGVHCVNASWEAVKELGQLGLPGIDLVIQEIPVEYEAVSTRVPALWKQHNPRLVVHVGVSGIASELTLEQRAHNDGYCKEDVRQCCPANTCCVEGSEQAITAAIDMQRVCDEVNRSSCGVKAVVSHDPGRYLCDFSFYTSLHIDRARSAFIHVPPLGKPYSAVQLAQGIQTAILAMLNQAS